MPHHPELQHALASPIPSIRTPFLRDGAINYPGLRDYVERCIAHGAQALMLTYGDSLFSLLTDAELADVTRAVVEQACGRAKIIAADRQWWTGKCVEWAKFCREIGADIVMVYPPDWVQSCTIETLADHYTAVSRELPVMLVTIALIKRDEEFRMELVRRLYENSPGVVSVKDDICGPFGQRMAAAVHDRWTVIAGGTKQIHFDLAPHGCRGHLSTLLVYKPDIARRYWSAVTAGDTAAAKKIVDDYDIPMFAAMSALPGSFDAGMHAWSELAGIHPRWRRAPYYNLTDAEMNSFAAQLEKLNLL
ncbi:MAG: dihydrodipicolinate synthase family protein [Planctomycetes bacterium]|nr:dihydrodipicolinate synthase family protein [Planctomycetota bacterium]